MLHNNPQSLSPLPTEDWDPTLKNVIDDMNGNPINVHKLMAHSPQLLQAWWNFRNYSVNGGTLGDRLGELVILRVGVHLSVWYEWGSHVDRSLRCGMTMEEIDRVLERGVSKKWTEAEAALLTAVDDLIETRCLSDECHQRLSNFFSVEQIFDIIAIHGMYLILGCMIKTWGLKLDDAVDQRICNHVTDAEFQAAAKRFHSTSTAQKSKA